MTKKTPLLNLLNTLIMLAGAFAVFGVGGLFINGTFTNVVILKLLPIVVHKVIGGLLMLSAILGTISIFIKK